MEYIFFKTDSKAWSDLWNHVFHHPINEGLDEPCTADNENYQWNYLGTFKNGKKAISEIRHQSHPKTNLPYKITYQHESFDEDEIGKRSRII